METIKKLFRNQMPSAVAAADKRLAAPFDLSSLSLPGINAKKTEVSLPAVVAPAPIIEQAAPAAKTITPAPVLRCQACGQALLPQMVIAQTGAQSVAVPALVVSAGPSPLNADWNDYEKTTLPPRTSSQIQMLIAAGETAEAREKRIISDKMRYKVQQGR